METLLADAVHILETFSSRQIFVQSTIDGIIRKRCCPVFAHKTNLCFHHIKEIKTSVNL